MQENCLRDTASHASERSRGVSRINIVERKSPQKRKLKVNYFRRTIWS